MPRLGSVGTCSKTGRRAGGIKVWFDNSGSSLEEKDWDLQPVAGPGLAWRVMRLIWQIQFLVFYILIQYYMYVPAHNRVSNMPLVADGE